MHIYPVGGHGLGLASEETQSYEYRTQYAKSAELDFTGTGWMQHL